MLKNRSPPLVPPCSSATIGAQWRPQGVAAAESSRSAQSANWAWPTSSGAMPAARALRSKPSTCSRSRPRRPAGSGCRSACRIWGTAARMGFAASTRGFRPPSAARSAAAAWRSVAGAKALRFRPGVGRTMVTSASSAGRARSLISPSPLLAPCERILAACRGGNFAGSKRAGKSVPLQRFGIVARDADQTLVVDVTEAFGGLAVAAARGSDIGLDRVLAPPVFLETLRHLERDRRAGGRRTWRVHERPPRPLHARPLRLERHLLLRQPVGGRPGFRRGLLRRGPFRAQLFGEHFFLGSALGGLLSRIAIGSGVGGELFLLLRARGVGLDLRFGLGCPARLGQLLLLGLVARLACLVLGPARFFERHARLLLLLLGLLELVGLLLRLLELLLHGLEFRRRLRIFLRQHEDHDTGNRKHHDADGRRVLD